MEILFVSLIVVCVLAAVFFTVVPIIPGSLFIFVGALLYGLFHSFGVFAWYFWVGQIILTALYLLIDNIAQIYGVKKLGGSKRAMWGGAIGVIAGPILCALVMGPLAIFIGPPLGAVVGVLVGEYSHRRKTIEDDKLQGKEAGKLAVGATAAYIIGTFAKLGILIIQLIWLLVIVFF